MLLLIKRRKTQVVALNSIIYPLNQDHQLVVTKNEKDDKTSSDSPCEEISDQQSSSQKLLPKLPRLLRPPPSRVKTEVDEGTVSGEGSPKVISTEPPEESASKRIRSVREALLQERKIWYVKLLFLVYFISSASDFKMMSVFTYQQ
jgi:hypothetical protein